jgi:hypothetical protein
MSNRVPAFTMETTCHFIAPGQDGDIVTSFGWTGKDADDPPVFADTDLAHQELMGNLNENITMVKISYRLGSAAADDPVVERAVEYLGLGGGLMTPVNNCYIVKKNTALGGRRHRGRNYLPGVSEGSVGNDGVLEAGIANGINTNVQDMRTAMSDAGCEMALLHQSAPWNPTAVVTALCESSIGTQRRRLSRG